MDILDQSKKGGELLNSGSLRFLRKWVSQFEDGERYCFGGYHVVKRKDGIGGGKGWKGVGILPKDRARTKFYCHNLSTA